MITKRIIFEGRVQGVGFRYATRQIALGFDVMGWVNNLPDGSVELVLEGEDQEVLEFIEEITEESTLSHHIKNFTQEDIAPLKNCVGFRITKNA
ncbi:MAG: acylphosphatase [Rubritalea sp.]|jgi:acylphosphatase